MRIAGIVIGLITCQLLSAQWKVAHQTLDWGEPYIVTTENDTLYGEVKYGKAIFGGVLNKVRFRQSRAKWTSFRANELNAFSLNGQVYSSQVIDGYSYFLRQVYQGEEYSLSFLEHNYVDRTNISGGLDQVHGTYGRMNMVYVSYAGRIERIYRSSFKSQMKRIFKNRRDVIQEIERNNWKIYDIERIFEFISS